MKASKSGPGAAKAVRAFWENVIKNREICHIVYGLSRPIVSLFKLRFFKYIHYARANEQSHYSDSRYCGRWRMPHDPHSGYWRYGGYMRLGATRNTPKNCAGQLLSRMLALGVFVSVSAWGESITFDSPYTTGPLSGQDSWSLVSGVTDAIQVTASNDVTVTSGGSIAAVARPMSANETNLELTWQWKATSGTGQIGFGPSKGESAGWSDFIIRVVLEPANSWIWVSPGGVAGQEYPVTLGEFYTVRMRINVGSKTFSLYIAPSSNPSNETTVVAGASFSATFSGTSLDRVMLMASSGYPEGAIDTITWEEVSPEKNWIGSVDANWSTAGNWSPPGAPVGTDEVYFTSGAQACILDQDASVQSVVFSSGYTGAFDFGTSNLSVQGIADFRSGGDVSAETGRLSFAGGGSQQFIPGAQNSYGSINQNGSGSTTVSGSLNADQLIVTRGVFNLGDGGAHRVGALAGNASSAADSLKFGTSVVTVAAPGGDIDLSALAMVADSGILDIAGSGTGALTLPNGVSFRKLKLSWGGTRVDIGAALAADTLVLGGGGTVGLGASLTHAIGVVSSAANGPVLDFSSATLTCGGDIDLSGVSSVVQGSGMLVLNGATGLQRLWPPAGSAALPPITKNAAAELSLQGELVASSYSQTAGALNLNGFDLSTSGNISITGGASSLTGLDGRTIASDGKIIFTGSAGDSIQLSAGSIWRVTAGDSLLARYAVLSNSDASASAIVGVARQSRDAGGNVGWFFGEPVAPSSIRYTSSSALYPVGKAIAPNEPAVSPVGAADSFSVDPPLPAGLVLDQSTGGIAGTPTQASPINTHTVTVTNPFGSAATELSIGVLGLPAFTYASNPAVYEQGKPISPNQPISTGGEIDSFTVSPALPEGLVLHAESGEISGTPAVIAASQTYAITGANAAGEASYELTIEVTEQLQPPSALTYLVNPARYGLGLEIQPNKPSAGGGPIDSFTVSPALPAGLVLDRMTGWISGAPETAQNAAAYTVTAVNEAGEATVDLSIAVIAPPAQLTYHLADAHYKATFAIEPNAPTVSGGEPDTFMVSPSLPAGLSLDGKTGVISGVPLVETPARSYTITAKNVAGEVSAELRFTIGSASDLVPPANDAALTLNVLSSTRIQARWTTPESPAADADSVWIFYSRTHTPTGYNDTGKTTLAVAPVSETAGENARVFDQAQPNTTYYFSLFVADTAGNFSQPASDSAVTTGGVRNPVSVTGVWVDTSTVRLTISNFAELESTPSQTDAWTDTLGVWYGLEKPAHPERASTALFRYALDDLFAAGDPYTVSVTVPAVAESRRAAYYFCPSVFWHTPEGDTLPPFVDGNCDSVPMYDATPVGNPLTAASVYTGNDSAITVTIGNIGSLEARSSRVGIWYGFTTPPRFNDTTHTVWLEAATLRNGPDSYAHTFKDSAFAGVGQLVYYAVAVKGTNGLLSRFVSGVQQVGVQPPSNTMILTAQSMGPQTVELRWDQMDSVRVWYGTQQIPLSQNPVGVSLRPFYPKSGALVDTISTLTPNTTYYFGLQRWEEGVWSLVTQASSASVTTDTVDPAALIPNVIAIDTIVFRQATNEILVKWRITDTTGLIDSGVQAGVDYSLSGFKPGLSPDIMTLTVTDPVDSTVLSYREGVLFDTTYYISMVVRKTNGIWSPSADYARDSITTPGFSWQKVVYFAPGQKEERAFNGSILLRKDGAIDQNENTVLKYEPQNLPAGLAPAGIGFSFETNLGTPPFLVGLKIDSTPTGVSDDSAIRLYRDSAGVFLVEHDSYVKDGYAWVRTRDFAFPFVALADKQAPRVAFEQSADTGAVIAAGQDVSCPFSITDEIGNIRWKLIAGTGNRTYEYSDSGTIASGGDHTSSIPGQYASRSYGMRALVIVDDGVYRDTVNISRRVAVDTADALFIPENRWMPIRVTARLDEPDVTPQLSVICAESESAYDTKLVRLFRWNPALQGTNGFGDWQEYSTLNKSDFSALAGQLLWMKVAQGSLIEFGAGTTIDLKKPFEVVLPPKKWSDFSTPFKFDIPLHEALAATGEDADSLELYRWTDSVSTYRAQPLYISYFPESTPSADSAFLLYSFGMNAYTVYNRLDRAVVLRIPPVPEALSAKRRAAPKRQANARAWNVSVRWSEKGGSGAGGEIMLGCAETGGAGAVYAPLPPSFGKIRAGVKQRNSGALAGHALMNGRHEGGLVWEIAFINDSGAPRTIACALHGSAPNGDRAIMFDPATRKRIEAQENGEVRLAGGESATRWVLAGSEGYIERMFDQAAAFNLAYLGAFPNPCIGRLAIRYRIPFDAMRAVSFGLYNALGAEVWRHSINNPLPGNNVLTWNGETSRGRLAPGMYVLRMHAKAADKTTTMVGQQRLLVVR